MEFWGVEVKAGVPLKVEPDYESIIHLSQAALGDTKNKGNESVILTLKFGDKKLVLGTLSSDKFPHLSFDLVFEREFELSHNWKHGSVYFCGYRSPIPNEEELSDDFGSSDDEDIPLAIADDDGKVEPKTEKPKPATTKALNAGKPEQKAKLVEPSKEDDSDDEDDEDESGEDDDSEEGLALDEQSDEDDDSDSDEDEDMEDSEDEETPTPKKAIQGKKRPNESASKTPASSKKAKVDTQKSDGKKSDHSATPHPAKKAGKAAANGNKSASPKSGGQLSCKPCNKSFGSENAFKAHSQAKHAGK